MIWKCCRSAIAAALTSWWANEFPENDTTSASVSNFGAVDAFPFTIVQPTDVTVLNATFVANISSGTPGQFTYVSQAWIGIQGNTSAFATNLGSSSSSRRLLTSSSSPSDESADRSVSMLHNHHISGDDNFAHRSLLQAAAGDISALETKLQGLAASFRGASPCNNTELARAYYNGSSPILNGDRPFYCVNFTVGDNDNIDTFLTSNSASWASLPLFHILVMNNNPVIVRQTPNVDVDSILATNVQYQLQQSQALQAGWQQQLRCVNATVSNRLQLHQLAALVQASLAVEGQMAEVEGLVDLYEQLLRRSNATDMLSSKDQQHQLQLALQLSENGAPVRLLSSLCIIRCVVENMYYSGMVYSSYTRAVVATLYVHQSQRWCMPWRPRTAKALQDAAHTMLCLSKSASTLMPYVLAYSAAHKAFKECIKCCSCLICTTTVAALQPATSSNCQYIPFASSSNICLCVLPLCLVL